MDTKLTIFGQKDLQFKVINMPPDGSCLFHSISYSVYGNNLYSNQVREKIVNHVSANWAKFQILTHDFKGDNYTSPENYRCEMLKPSTYGSACELIAASELFQCVFKVYHDGQLIQSFGVERATSEYHILFTGNLGSGHFDVLEATHSTKNNPKLEINSDVVFANNYEIAPETPPKEKRRTVSQCVGGKVVNFNEHSTEQMKAKGLKRKSSSQPVETPETPIIIYHKREVLQEKEEPCEEQNKNTNLDLDNFLENVKQLDEASKEDEVETKKKRAKRKGRFSNLPRLKQQREAAAKYRMMHPEVNRKAATTYAQKNPEVHRKSVTTYAQKNPEVNRKAVTTYALKNPEVNRKAVTTYAQKNPEVHRKSVTTYAQKNPEVNRVAAAKYSKKNPEVNRAAASKYDQNHEKRQQRKHKMWTANAKSGYEYDPNISYESDKIISIGPMEILCSHCKALKWKNESKGLCCDSGKVCINRLEKRPEPLHSLIVGGHPESEHFLSNSRKYNSAFQMTSFGAKQIVESGFMPTFKVQGQVYHLIGSLLPSSNNDDHQFLQLYFIGDDNKETIARCDKVPGIKPALVNMIQKMLHNCNTYVMDFKCAIENMPEDSRQFQVVIHADKKPTNAHRGRYNEPVSGEVGAVIVGQEFGKRDILIKGRDNKLQRISETHRAYDALQYPLMFCYGEDGYSISIHQYDPVTKTHLQKTVSAASYYCFRLMVLSEEINYLHHFRGLLNQFMVDMYAKIETERLNFIRNNQKKLRAENYVHLKDAVGKGDTNPEDLGQAVILPSTFTGGARYMHERTQDAMTYVRHYGRPDLFITFTCNPKWDEITENLIDGQNPQDRHDLISRVFHLKVKCMINLLTKVGIFGPSLCFMYTIEWQKRGLPHAHILLWLKNKIKPEQIDQVICAEIPDPEEDPKLYNIVKSTMIHGPCGDLNKKSPCMVKGSCSKQYPRPLLKETQTGDDGYPKYRRRASNDGGHTVKINNLTLDNRWVVPYNPVLSRTFNAHINVEFCNSVKSIKYVCKYVNKGSDQAVFSLSEQRDEVTQYESGRYISSSEAAWRIFCFPIHERFPPVFHLAVHLENGQRVYFTSTNVTDRVNNPTKTTLIGFFELCQNDDFAKGLLYCEVPAYYVWKSNKFVRRKQGLPVQSHVGIKKDHVLGRVYTIHPNNFECYYLRLLLHEVRGPTSFEHLKTVRGVVHPTFKAACSALGLLEDDSHWDHTLEEASLSDSPHKIRELLATMLVFCQVGNPMELWENHKESLADDIKRSIEKEFGDVEQVKDIVYNRCLLLLEDLVYSISGNSLEHYGLPTPSRQHETVTTNRELLRELNYDVAQLSDAVAVNAAKLNKDQNKVYKEITRSITSESGKLFFLDAPGGTGKTFLINLLLAKVRSEKKIAIAVASSGIAATLLDGGKTAHSAFKIPLNLNHTETPMCNISKQCNLAQVLREAKLIVWDECTMAHKGAIEALDRTLRDIRNCNRLMGGITILLAGDFRQTLPVVPRGTRADEVKACLKSSYLWPKIKILTLRLNMRVYLKGDLKSEEFSALLLQIGDGKMLEDTDGKSVIPQSLCSVVHDLTSLLCKTYPDINDEESRSLTWLQERAILTPTNESASGINLALLEQLPGKMSRYESVDSVVEAEDAVHYPVEFLHSLNPPGIPPHVLFLKIGAPIMLLRNLNPPKLCNGTRLQVKALHKHVIEATIFTGIGQGETVLIPRIPMIPSDHPFQFKRLQFPVKVCYAMTINKAQGQSLKVAGVDLRNDCFSHGQLYVACSRVSSPDSLVILQPEGRTKNIVYQEVLRK